MGIKSIGAFCRYKPLINAMRPLTVSMGNLVHGVYRNITDFINDSLSRDFELKTDQWVFTGGITSCRVYEPGPLAQLSCDGLLGISFKVP